MLICIAKCVYTCCIHVFVGVPIGNICSASLLVRPEESERGSEEAAALPFLGCWVQPKFLLTGIAILFSISNKGKKIKF